MAEETVQGDTESGADAGVYTESTPETTETTEQTIDPGVAEASQKAAEAQPETQEVDYKFEMPEGIEANQKAIDAFIPIMKKLNIPQEAAQEIVNIQAGIAREAIEAQQTAVSEARDKWVSDITSDKELGGEKLEETIYVANQALSKVGTDGFKQLLTQTGLGDHPEVIRVFHKLGKMLGDDGFVQGRPASQTGIGKMYNNSPDLK